MVPVLELEDGETLEDLDLKWHRVGDMMEGNLRKLTKRGRSKGDIQHHMSKAILADVDGPVIFNCCICGFECTDMVPKISAYSWWNCQATSDA